MPGRHEGLRLIPIRERPPAWDVEWYGELVGRVEMDAAHGQYAGGQHVGTAKALAYGLDGRRVGREPHVYSAARLLLDVWTMPTEGESQ